MNTNTITDERKTDINELIAFSRKWSALREKAAEITDLIRREDDLSTELNLCYETTSPAEWLEKYHFLKLMQKRIKLMICAFAKKHYGKDSICVEIYRGKDFVDTIWEFRELARVCYGIER